MFRKSRRTDRRSPVQPGGGSPLALALLMILAVAVVFTIREDWFDSFAPPYSISAISQPDMQSRSNGVTGTAAMLRALFTSADYPDEALRKGEQGTTAVRLAIDRQGKVSDCTVIESSGSSSLDQATCNVLTSRAQFTPARDSRGRPTSDTYVQRIKWQLQ